MLNWYLDEHITHERLEDFARAVERQHQVEEALAGRRRHDGAPKLVAAHGSRMLVWIGRRLVAWGQRLQQPPEAGTVKHV
jgi:hypothetical protein